MFTSCYPISFLGRMLCELSGRRESATKKGTSRNIIVCRTHDEVNANLARSWCDDHGLDFQLTDQRDELFPAEASAIAVDLNHLAFGPKERSQFVKRLCSSVLPYPVAVASYDFGSKDIAMLRARGALVFRCIDHQLFYRLMAAIDYDRAEFAA